MLYNTAALPAFYTRIILYQRYIIEELYCILGLNYMRVIYIKGLRNVDLSINSHEVLVL